MAGVAAAPLMLASSAVSAYGQMRAGQAQREMYDEQAAQARMRGRSEAIAYKQQGADVLRNLNENLAAIIARSAAGGVDPTSGSAAVMQQYAMAEGIREKNIAADNALLAEGQAATQAHQYRMAGRAAQQASFFQAAGTLGMGIYRHGQLA
jgi:hypothetical protein